MLRLKNQVSHTAVAGKFSYRLGGRVHKMGFPPLFDGILTVFPPLYLVNL